MVGNEYLFKPKKKRIWQANREKTLPSKHLKREFSIISTFMPLISAILSTKKRFLWHAALTIRIENVILMAWHNLRESSLIPYLLIYLEFRKTSLVDFTNVNVLRKMITLLCNYLIVLYFEYYFIHVCFFYSVSFIIQVSL